MTSTPPPPQSADAGAAPGFFDSLRRLNIPRSQERWIGGVAGGIAARLGIDPLIVRGLFLVITIFGGFGLLVYGLCWALLPEAADGRIHLQEAIRGRFDAALVGAAVLAVIGLSRVGFWWDGWVGIPFMIGMIALVALAVVVVTAIRNSSSSTPPGGTSGPSGGASGPPGGGTPPPTAHPGSGGHVPFSTAHPGAGGYVPFSTAHPQQSGAAELTTGPGRQPSQITTGEPGGQDAGGPWAEVPTGGPWSDEPSEGGAPATGAPAPGATVEPVTAEHPTTEPPVEEDTSETTVLAAQPDAGADMNAAGETDTSASPATAHLGTGAPPAGAYPTTATTTPSGTDTAADQTSTWPGYRVAENAAASSAGADATPPATPPPPPATSPPPQPAKPPRRGRPGPGSVLVRVTYGLALLAVAALVLAAHYFEWQANAWLVALGGGLVIFGLGATMAGVLGRRSGSLGVLGTLLAIVLVPWAISAPVLTQYNFADSSSYGDRFWSPQTAEQAADGYTLAAGVIRVDLSDLADEQVTTPIDIELGAGDVELLIPDGMPVTVTASVQGETTAVNLSDWSAVVNDESRDLGDRTDLGWRLGTSPMVAELTSPEAGDAPPIPVNIDVGFGAIQVRELR